MPVDSEVSVPFLAVTTAVGAVVLLMVLLCNVVKKSQREQKDHDSDTSKKKENGSSKPKTTSQQQPRKAKTTKQAKTYKTTFTHPWLVKTIKGPGAPILGLDFSPNGKYLISCSEDRSLFLWSTKDIESKEYKSIRGNVELDHATNVSFSPDSRSFIVSLCNNNSIRVFKIGKKPDGSPLITAALDFPQKYNKAEILKVGISSSGQFIMSCFKDTTFIVWDLKGEVLATIDTHQMNNSHGAVSPCGRLIASSGFTPDVKVWEVVFDKGGNFKEVTKAFDLKGHKAGVYSFDFNCDSTRMASVSKDGTWKIWDTNVSYHQNQDPYLLFTGSHNFSGATHLAFAPDALTLALSNGTTIALYDANTGEREQEFTDVHSESINCLSFDISSNYLASTGDKTVQILHNIPGYDAKVRDLERKITKTEGKAMKERLENQIDSARKAKNAILKKISA